jgi:GGDEF domain-containing protein
MQTARSSDALGRFGGDEFLYLIDRDVSSATVERACLRLAGAVSFAVELETAGMSLSASIGAAIYPGDGRTQDALLTAADSAMYAAKANGTGYCMASAATQPRSSASPTNGEGKAADGHAAPAPAEDQTPRPARPGERSSVAAAAGATGQASVGHRSENRRSERRHRVFKRGRIIFGDGFSTIDCMIRDLSQRGARISVEDQLSVPSRFSFAVLDSGEVYIAARRWQRGRSIGLEFLIDPGQPAAD